MAEERVDREAGMQPAASSCLSDADNAAVEYPFLGFEGSYSHSIDSKGRLIIPASFRGPLGPRFAVAPTPDFKAVALYTLEGWKEQRDELLALVKLDARAQMLLDQFSKYSFVDCEADSQGRLLMPQKIRAWRLGDVKEVDLNGATSYIRVMPKAVSDDQDVRFDEMFPDPLAYRAAIQQGKLF